MAKPKPKIITNSRRKRRVKEFVDKDHEVMDRYYELVTEEKDREKVLGGMWKLIKKDSDFYDPYLIVAEFLEDEEEFDKAKSLRFQAYSRALARIVDFKGRYPETLKWGWLENRHIIRAIYNWAILLWEERNNQEALDIFRRLLRSNPNDNTGCRFDILSIKMNLPSSFLVDKFGNGKYGGLDGLKVSEWFDKNSKRFPEEFGWWFKEMERRF